MQKIATYLYPEGTIIYIYNNCFCSVKFWATELESDRIGDRETDRIIFFSLKEREIQRQRDKEKETEREKNKRHRKET